jgi:hypothetical protein
MFAKGKLFLERVEVDPLVDIPIPDRVGILFLVISGGNSQRRRS